MTPPDDVVLAEVLVGAVVSLRYHGTVTPPDDVVLAEVLVGAVVPLRYHGTVTPPEAVVLASVPVGTVATLLLTRELPFTGDIGSLLQAARAIAAAAANTGIRTTRATIEAGITSS